MTTSSATYPGAPAGTPSYIRPRLPPLPDSDTGASAASSSTLSLAARQVAVSVISITDNVARIKIGSKFYDADITEQMPDSAGSIVNKKLTMTEEIAQKVQEHFQTLLAQGAFTVDTKEITLSGDTNFNFTDIKTIDSTGAQTTKKITDLAGEAQIAVTQLGSYLVSQDSVLHSIDPLTSSTQVAAPIIRPPLSGQPPSPIAPPLPPVSAALPPPIPPASTVRDPSPPAPPTGTKLTEQFLTRGLDTSNPVDHINQLYKSTDPQFPLKAANALAKHLSDGLSSPDGFAQDTDKLELIKNELRRLAAKDKTSLEDAAKDVLNGFWPWRTEAFVLGSINFMKSGNFDSFDPKDLVRLYANYLVKKGISDKMGDSFYGIFAEFAKDTSDREFKRMLQIRILGKKGANEIEPKEMYPRGQGVIPGICIYLLQEGVGNAATFKAYKREHRGLESLDDFTDTAPGPVPDQAQRAPAESLQTMLAGMSSPPRRTT